MNPGSLAATAPPCSHHSWYAVLGELHRRAGHNPTARRYMSKGAHFTGYERGAGAGSAAACFS